MKHRCKECGQRFGAGLSHIERVQKLELLAETLLAHSPPLEEEDAEMKARPLGEEELTPCQKRKKTVGKMEWKETSEKLRYGRNCFLLKK